MKKILNFLSKEGKTLFTLCFFDLFLTYYLVSLSVVKELNPLMGYLLEKGDLFFISGKFLLNTLSILLLEMVRQDDSANLRVKRIERILIFIYLMIFINVLYFICRNYSM